VAGVPEHLRLPLHPCSHPGCGTLTRERWCAAHKLARYRDERERRGSTAERGYGSKWNRYRLRFLREHPLCAECARQGRTTLANVVDHITPHRGDQRLFWNPANHQALCDHRSPWNCHGKKTALEDGAFGRDPKGGGAGK